MEQNRRTFLSTALAAAPLYVPRSAFGANDRIAFGLIGGGGRGRYLTDTFLKLGTRCVAVAEVYEPYRTKARELAPEAKAYEDYRELLRQEGKIGRAHV